jgi:hypothetical protein
MPVGAGGLQCFHGCQKAHGRTPAQQQAFMSTFDWKRMTEQDEAVWNPILSHLKETE